ncbi:MAG: hypothetical protein HY276_09810 [Ignavibacteriales bacterium]|nr:hypothetical protein [Ignavibacteriales bacterium]
MGENNNNIPFVLWLAQNFLPAEEERAEETTPISDREFYFSMALIATALSLFSMFMRGCIF